MADKLRTTTKEIFHFFLKLGVIIPILVKK